MTIQGHYLYTGVTVTLSKGRWVATNVIGIIAMGVISLALSALAVLARAPLFFIVLLGLAAAFVFQVYLLLWSLKPNLPPR